MCFVSSFEHLCESKNDICAGSLLQLLFFARVECVESLFNFRTVLRVESLMVVSSTDLARQRNLPVICWSLCFSAGVMGSVLSTVAI